MLAADRPPIPYESSNVTWTWDERAEMWMGLWLMQPDALVTLVSKETTTNGGIPNE